MIGIGSKLQIESETPGTYTDIVGVDSLSPSLGELQLVESTDFDSPDNGEEQEPGLLKWGEVSGEGNYNGHTSQIALVTAMHGRALKNFKVVLPAAVTAGGKTFSFAGYVTKFQVTTPTKDKMRFSFSITVNAKPTLA